MIKKFMKFILLVPAAFSNFLKAENNVSVVLLAENSTSKALGAMSHSNTSISGVEYASGISTCSFEPAAAKKCRTLVSYNVRGLSVFVAISLRVPENYNDLVVKFNFYGARIDQRMLESGYELNQNQLTVKNSTNIKFYTDISCNSVGKFTIEGMSVSFTQKGQIYRLNNIERCDAINDKDIKDTKIAMAVVFSAVGLMSLVAFCCYLFHTIHNKLGKPGEAAPLLEDGFGPLGSGINASYQ